MKAPRISSQGTSASRGDWQRQAGVEQNSSKATTPPRPEQVRVGAAEERAAGSCDSRITGIVAVWAGKARGLLRRLCGPQVAASSIAESTGSLTGAVMQRFDHRHRRTDAFGLAFVALSTLMVRDPPDPDIRVPCGTTSPSSRSRSRCRDDGRGPVVYLKPAWFTPSASAAVGDGSVLFPVVVGRQLPDQLRSRSASIRPSSPSGRSSSPTRSSPPRSC